MRALGEVSLAELRLARGSDKCSNGYLVEALLYRIMLHTLILDIESS